MTSLNVCTPDSKGLVITTGSKINVLLKVIQSTNSTLIINLNFLKEKYPSGRV